MGLANEGRTRDTSKTRREKKRTNRARMDAAGEEEKEKLLALLQLANRNHHFHLTSPASKLSSPLRRAKWVVVRPGPGWRGFWSELGRVWPRAHAKIPILRMIIFPAGLAARVDGDRMGTRDEIVEPYRLVPAALRWYPEERTGFSWFPVPTSLPPSLLSVPMLCWERRGRA